LDLVFESVVSSFIADEVGITPDFLNPDLARKLRDNLIDLHEADALKKAAIGNMSKRMRDPSTRGDQIYWLDRKHDTPEEHMFFDLIDDFVVYLNRTCFTAITGYEFHYALYEPGTFYKRHIDQFRDDPSRTFSVVMYLNDAWQEGDGGELCIHRPEGTQLIAPTMGKCVFFKSSQIEHEVLLSHKRRLSVTGWLKTG
jgi:SM-20-related protein